MALLPTDAIQPVIVRQGAFNAARRAEEAVVEQPARAEATVVQEGVSDPQEGIADPGSTVHHRSAVFGARTGSDVDDAQFGVRALEGPSGERVREGTRQGRRIVDVGHIV